MKYSDFVAKQLVQLGYTHCFFLAGGNIMHLLESMSNEMECIPVAHENTGIIAAEYLNSLPGDSKAIALVTAGPGITNSLTGISGANLESRELLVIGGTVKTIDLSSENLRQRGIQEINVAYGGTLHYRVHLLDDKNDHRMPRGDDVTVEQIFKLKHRIDFVKNGYFSKLLKKDSCLVNSLHGQAIDIIANNLKIEALSDDGIIEAVSIPDHPSFAVGVQWHAEYEPEKNELNRCLFTEFGSACSIYSKKK